MNYVVILLLAIVMMTPIAVYAGSEYEEDLCESEGGIWSDGQCKFYSDAEKDNYEDNIKTYEKSICTDDDLSKNEEKLCYGYGDSSDNQDD